MKKLLSFKNLILFLLIIFLIESCEKEENQFIGRWHGTTTRVTYFNNDKLIEDTLLSNVNRAYEFFKQGNGNMYFIGDLQSTFTWEVKNNTLVFNWDDNTTTKYDYSISSTALTLKNEIEHQSNYRLIYESFYIRE